MLQFWSKTFLYYKTFPIFDAIITATTITNQLRLGQYYLLLIELPMTQPVFSTSYATSSLNQQTTELEAAELSIKTKNDLFLQRNDA